MTLWIIINLMNWDIRCFRTQADATDTAIEIYDGRNGNCVIRLYQYSGKSEPEFMGRLFKEEKTDDQPAHFNKATCWRKDF